MSYFDDNEDRIVYGRPPRFYKVKDVTCKHCKESGLEWVDTGVRWRLVGPDGRFHECKNDSAADDFEVLP